MSDFTKPNISGDVEVPIIMSRTPEGEHAPTPSPPVYQSTSYLPQTIGGPADAVTGDVRFKVGGVPIEISEKQVPMVGMLLSSMINLIAACVGVSSSQKYYEYAIASGAVGMCFSLIGITLSWKPAWDNGSMGKWVSAICFLWSFIAGCILTFGRGPFVQTGNGYFSSWAMVIFSIQTLGVTAKDMKDSAYDGSSLLGLGLASVILIIGLSSELVDNTTDKVNLIYSLILAIVTLIFVERLRDFESNLKSFILTCFAVMWVASACLLTFDGPFATTGNGYFAAWAAAITCVFAANDEFLENAKAWIDRNIVTHVKHFAGQEDDEGGDIISKAAANTHNASSASALASGRSQQMQGAGLQQSLYHDAAMAPLGNEDTGTAVNTLTLYVEDLSTEELFQLSLDLPGVDQADVDVHLEGTTLIISGTRNADDAASARTMAKSFEMDLDTVDTDNISAKLTNGVLLVTAPKKKKEKAIPKKITVS